jgi:hypothetical protein
MGKNISRMDCRDVCKDAVNSDHRQCTERSSLCTFRFAAPVTIGRTGDRKRHRPPAATFGCPAARPKSAGKRHRRRDCLSPWLALHALLFNGRFCRWFFVRSCARGRDAEAGRLCTPGTTGAEVVVANNVVRRSENMGFIMCHPCLAPPWRGWRQKTSAPFAVHAKR